jgi:hypothetical protein
MNELGDRLGVAKTIIGFAAIALAQSRSDRAGTLLGVVDALLTASEASLSVVDQADYSKLLAQTRTSVEPILFESAWASGRSLDLGEAISYALAY